MLRCAAHDYDRWSLWHGANKETGQKPLKSKLLTGQCGHSLIDDLCQKKKNACLNRHNRTRTGRCSERTAISRPQTDTEAEDKSSHRVRFCTHLSVSVFDETCVDGSERLKGEEEDRVRGSLYGEWGARGRRLIYRWKESAGNISWLSRAHISRQLCAHYQFVHVFALYFPGETCPAIGLLDPRARLAAARRY